MERGNTARVKCHIQKERHKHIHILSSSYLSFSKKNPLVPKENERIQVSLEDSKEECYHVLQPKFKRLRSINKMERNVSILTMYELEVLQFLLNLYIGKC